ncbi:alpha-amylase [Chryseobacterium daecheongense]|nr:alpha-amylase [Chryseobacterium daecheongense]
MNGVIMQFFHWYYEGNLWKEFLEKADDLKELGITAVWFPPATKGGLGKEGRGYDVYDLYDLGEFDQKGTVATRYGTKEEYLTAIQKAHDIGMSVYADIVLNHRIGGDEKEDIIVHEVNGENRNEMVGDSFSASAFTKFTFPGRNGKYSDFIWDFHCFSGIDTIVKDNNEKQGVFKIHNTSGQEWNDSVSHQFGNYDYLMGADVEYRNPEVVTEMKRWIKWYVDTTKVDGLRLDALKHISYDFLKEWIIYIKTELKPDIFIMGELWKDEVVKINDFSEFMEDLLCYFDVPLHYHFYNASNEEEKYDLRNILDGTLLSQNPRCSVSFVENHDTQKLQALESVVKDWFKPIAYTLILMNENAYPCIFYPDLYGAEYTDLSEGKEIKVSMPKVHLLPLLLKARQEFAHGEQINYFDDPNCIAWMRKGDEKHKGCIIIISNNGEGAKEIDLGKENANSEYSDFLQQRKDKTKSDENGRAVFKVNARSVSIWIQK